MKIVLIGYMGSGKSTSGDLLAKNLKVDFIDLDTYITKKYNQSISEIFENEGEEKFRELESTYLKEVLKKNDVVIAVGGGTPCFNNNMMLIKQQAISVYIKMDAKSLTKRLLLSKTPRPLIKGKSEKELLEFIQTNLNKREPYYQQATYTIDPEQKSVDQLAEAIKNLIKNDLIRR